MKPRNHVALAMLKAPKRGSLVHQRKVGNHRRSIAMEIEWEDVPCYKITVEVYVSGNDHARAWEHLNAVLSKAATKRDEERDIFDWDFVDWEQA